MVPRSRRGRLAAAALLGVLFVAPALPAGLGCRSACQRAGSASARACCRPAQSHSGSALRGPGCCPAPAPSLSSATPVTVEPNRGVSASLVMVAATTKAFPIESRPSRQNAPAIDAEPPGGGPSPPPILRI